MDTRPVCAGCVLARAQPVVLETLFKEQLMWHLLLSSLWDLRGYWSINICVSRLAFVKSSRAAGYPCSARSPVLTRDTVLGCLPPACCALLGSDVSITVSSSTLACVFTCNLGPINNVFAVILAVHSMVALVRVPVRNTSEPTAGFVQSFQNKSSLFRLPRDACSYVS